LSLLGRDPTVAQKFMASLAREVMSLRTRLEVLNIRSASERILRGFPKGAKHQQGDLGGDERHDVVELGHDDHRDASSAGLWQNTPKLSELRRTGR